MDVDAPQYAADHAALRATILQLEHRLGALIIQVRAAEGAVMGPGTLCSTHLSKVAGHTVPPHHPTNPLCQAFDDCKTLSSTFKLLDSFEGLLEREAIAAELAKKQVRGVSRGAMRPLGRLAGCALC